MNPRQPVFREGCDQPLPCKAAELCAQGSCRDLHRHYTVAVLYDPRLRRKLFPHDRRPTLIQFRKAIHWFPSGSRSIATQYLMEQRSNPHRLPRALTSNLQ